MKESQKGCLELAAITFFAILFGALVASTVIRHIKRDSGSPQAGSTDRQEPVSPSRERIRVEVRNGSGEAGVAAEIMLLLRREGFDVVDFGNAERFDYERTSVIDRVGDSAKAREVATVLPGVPIRSEPDPELYLDVTVILGRDLQEVVWRRQETGTKPKRWFSRWRERLGDIWR